MLSPIAHIDFTIGIETYAALVVAILAALTIYAYRYPNGYPAAAVIICSLLIVSTIGVVVWNVGISVAYQGIVDVVPFEQRDQIRIVEDELYMPDTILFGILAAFVYVCLLLWFPRLGLTGLLRRNQRDD